MPSTYLGKAIFFTLGFDRKGNGVVDEYSLSVSTEVSEADLSSCAPYKPSLLHKLLRY